MKGALAQERLFSGEIAPCRSMLTRRNDSIGWERQTSFSGKFLLSSTTSYGQKRTFAGLSIYSLNPSLLRTQSLSLVFLSLPVARSGGRHGWDRGGGRLRGPRWTKIRDFPDRRRAPRSPHHGPRRGCRSDNRVRHIVCRRDGHRLAGYPIDD